MTQFLGFPLVAFIVVLLCAAFVWNWYLGTTPWLVGVFAIGIALRTFSAVSEVQRYKTWRKAWNAMSDPGGGRNNTPSRKGKFLVPLVWIIFVAFVAQIPEVRAHENTVIALSVTGALIVLIVGRFIQNRQRRTKLTGAGNAPVIDAPVSWLVGRPGTSPSRSDATRSLPEYSASILSSGQLPRKAS